MNYFDKELKNTEKGENSQISSELLWIEANTNKKNSPRYMWFVYLMMMLVLVFCFYMLSCTIFGFGWIKNIFDTKTQTVGNFEYVLPLADKPELEGDGIYQADGRYTVAGISKLMRESAVTVYAYSEDSKYSIGQGSGFIFSEDGYIITNAHVVDNGNTSYLSVRLSDDTYYNGKLIGCDLVTDIAVLKIQANNLKAVTFGDSEQIIQGEEVVAYGNPAGLTASVTAGIVSGLGRNVTLNEMELFDCIQIDAAINPGNSGGALLNMWGQVVGIVSAKLESDEYDGIGFAISTAEAKPVIESIIEHGCVVGRVKIGIEFYEISQSDASDTTGMTSGLFIINIDSSCDIYNSGLKAGDIITSIDGKKVTTAGDVAVITQFKKPGDVVEFTYSREGEEYTSQFALMEANTFRVVELNKQKNDKE